MQPSQARAEVVRRENVGTDKEEHRDGEGFDEIHRAGVRVVDAAHRRRGLIADESARLVVRVVRVVRRDDGVPNHHRVVEVKLSAEQDPQPPQQKQLRLDANPVQVPSQRRVDLFQPRVHAVARRLHPALGALSRRILEERRHSDTASVVTIVTIRAHERREHGVRVVLHVRCAQFRCARQPRFVIRGGIHRRRGRGVSPAMAAGVARRGVLCPLRKHQRRELVHALPIPQPRVLEGPHQQQVQQRLLDVGRAVEFVPGMQALQVERDSIPHLRGPEVLPPARILGGLQRVIRGHVGGCGRPRPGIFGAGAADVLVETPSGGDVARAPSPERRGPALRSTRPHGLGRFDGAMC